MKKILAMLLAISMLLAFAACGERPAEDGQINPDEVVENVEVNDKTEAPEEDKAPATDETAQKPAENKPTENKPAENQPAEDKKEESAKTVGNALLGEFKAQAGNKDALAIAESLAQNSILPFMAGAMEVEPGLLSGFDNYEVKGFKKGATFMPMMGSIAFVGYVFELEDNVKPADFIANLKKNANLRWNICVEAEEMVTGNVGNKVFFVMCPKQFEA